MDYNDKKFGIILPSFVYAPFRVDLVNNALVQLAKTQWDGSIRPKLLLLVRPSPHWFTHSIDIFKDSVFDVAIEEGPEGILGSEVTLGYGTEKLFNEGMDFVTWMGDDAAFNSLWLIKLKDLIERHPASRSWSVYRSAHIAYHSPLLENDKDVMVKSICGHGLTFSKEEWKDWNVVWRAGCWPCTSVAGDTMDIYHAESRPGERWVTKYSYVEHTGRVGLHCDPSTPEYAVNFVGVE